MHSLTNRISDRCTAGLLAVGIFIACGSQHNSDVASTNISFTDKTLTRYGADATFDRVSCGVFDRDGRLAICDNAEGKLFLFDSNGQYKFAFGRRGAGPGEFHSISGAHFDSLGNLSVWDGGRRKMVMIDSAGKLVRDVQMAEMTGWIPRYLGQTKDGRFMFIEKTLFGPRVRVPEGLVPSWTKLLAFDSTSRRSTILDSIVLREEFVAGNGFQRVTFQLPFRADGDAVVVGNKLVSGFSRDSVYFVRNVLSGKVDTTPLPFPAYTISNRVWEAAWDAARNSSTPNEFSERIQAAKSKVPRILSRPRFASLYKTPRGTVAAYGPLDATGDTYGLRCLIVAAGDRCPSIRTVQGEVVIAISSGVAAVSIEQPDGTLIVVLRSVVESARVSGSIPDARTPPPPK